MQSKKKITVDVQRRDVIPPIYVKQYDANTRYIELTILDGGEAFTMPTNPVFMIGVVTAGRERFLYDQMISATAPLGLTVYVDTQAWAAAGLASGTFTYDGTAWKLSGAAVDLADYGVTVTGTPESGASITVTTEDAVSYSQNVVTFGVHQSAFLTAGDAFVELYICNGDEQISSFKLTLRVESAACPPTIQDTPQSFVLLTAQIQTYITNYFDTHDHVTSVNGMTGDVVLPAGVSPGAIADTFSANHPYVVGDYCMKDGQLYRCTTAHTGEWAAADFEATSVTDNLGDEDAVKYTAQSLTLAQKKQALLNLDGVRIVNLTDGTTTLAELTAMIAGINTDGEHVFFDTSSLGYPLYLCTIAINYTGSTPTSYRLSDLVTGAVSVGDYDGSITLAEILGAAAVVTFPIAISVTTPPTKTTYEIGESLDPTGMVVTVMLSDGSTRTVDNSDLTFSPATFTAENAQAIVTVTYHSGYYTLTTTLTVAVVAIIPNTWAKRVQVSAAGLGRQYFEIGEAITDTYTVGANVYTNIWRVMDFRDVETEDGVVHQNVPIIQMQYTTHENVVFDPAETTEATEETAQAGYYYCGYDGSNYTMLNLSTGATIPYSSYTKVYKTLWNSVNAIRYGLNNWKLSFARQYLNGLGTGWATPQHACDVLPANAASMTGFKSYMPSDMLAALHPIKIKTRQTNYMGGALDETLDLFWLASISEMNMQNNNASPDDGTPWEYYKELFESESKVNMGTYDVMKRYAVNATTAAQSWWTRSALLGTVFEWVVYVSGNVDYYSFPYDSYRLLPACAII